MTVTNPDELGGAVIPDPGDLRVGPLGLVRFDERPPTPWKNGQGSTREVARRLLGGRGPEFVWRLSVAEITKDADFSAFPGVQRTLTLIEGDGVRVDVAGDPHELAPYQPFLFDGGAESHAKLTHGPVRVLNVMTKSNRMSAGVRILDLSDGRPVSVNGPTVAMQLSGTSRAYAIDGTNADLGQYDALIPKQRVRLLVGTGLLAVVRFENFRVWRWY